MYLIYLMILNQMCIVIKMTAINHTTTTNNKEHIDSGELHTLLLMFIKYDIAIITLQFNTLEYVIDFH